MSTSLEEIVKYALFLTSPTDSLGKNKVHFKFFFIRASFLFFFFNPKEPH